MLCLKWKRPQAGSIDVIFLYLHRLFKEAKAEAERRLADFDAADAAEQGETGDNAVLKTVEADDFEDDDS